MSVPLSELLPLDLIYMWSVLLIDLVNGFTLYSRVTSEVPKAPRNVAVIHTHTITNPSGVI